MKERQIVYVVFELAKGFTKMLFQRHIYKSG